MDNGGEQVMVSHAKTKIKYRGKMASGYEARRVKQQRWHIENDAVKYMLQGMRGTVLDVPCGSGRYFALYRKLGLKPVLAIDSSKEMLALAKEKLKPGQSLMFGDATNLWPNNKSWDIAVCVRFLDLIDQDAMYIVLDELDRVTRNCMILTIRFGPRYIPKSNTATHDETKFRKWMQKHYWHQTDAVPIFKQGWVVLKLERTK
jgi:ubiquinone/menaquinone biosynthesis C-methylase UbiE